MKNKLPKKDKGLGFLRHWKVMTMTLLLLTFSIGQMWAYTYNHATSVPEWTVNFNTWSAEDDAATKTEATVHNPRLFWNSTKWDQLSAAQDVAFDADGFYYIYQPGTARQLPTGSALSALSYVVAKAQGSYFKYNSTSSTVTSPVSSINGLTTNSSQTADVAYEFHMPRAGYVRLLIGTDSNGDPTGTANDAWKNVTLSGATTGNVAVTYHANGSTYDVKTKTGATTFSTVTYTSAGKKMRSVEFELNSGTTTMTTNPAKLSNNSGTARKMFIYAVEVYLESAAPVTNYTVTIDPNGGSYASTPDGWTYDSENDKYTKSVASGTSFSAPAGLSKGTDALTWKDGSSNDVTFPVSITGNITFVAQWTPVSAEPTISAHPSTADVLYIKDAAATALSVTASGSGTVTYQWYSNTTASNTDGTILENCTTATCTPSTAATGKLYYYCEVTNTETSKSPTTIKSNVSGLVRVVPAPTHLVENVMATSGSWDSYIVSANSHISNLKTIAASDGKTLIKSGKESASSSRTPGITSNSSATLVESDYIYIQFTIEDGYELAVSAVSVPVFSISNTGKYVARISDNAGTPHVIETAETSVAQSADGDPFTGYDFSSSPTLTGTVTLKLFAYGWDKGYRMKSPVYIDGEVKAVGACTTPTIVWDGDQPADAYVSDESKTFKVTSNYTDGINLELSSNTCGATIAAKSGSDNKQWVVSFTGAGSVTITPKVVGDGSTVCAETVSAAAKTLTVTLAHDVTFNMNGHGAAIAKQVVADGGKATAPYVADVADWVFGGWFTDAECTAGNEFDFANTTISADRPLYAKWTADACAGDRKSLSKVVLTSTSAGTVTGYNGDEYAGSAVINNLKDDDQTAEVDASHDGLEEGYKLNGSKSTVFATLKKGTFQEGDKVVVTITKANDAYKVESVAQKILDIYYGDSKDDATLLTTIEGVNAAGTYAYRLTAADVTAIGSKKGIGVYRPGEGRTQNPYVYSVEITGCRSFAVTHKVTYNLQGYGDPIAAQYVEDGKKATKPADPEETGFIFGGWYKEAACTNAWDFANDVVEIDTELFAKWTADPCTDRQSLSKVVLTSATAGTVTGYNNKEYAGTELIASLSGTKSADLGSGSVTGYKLANGGASMLMATLKKGDFQEGDKVTVGVVYQNDQRTVDASTNIMTIYAGSDASHMMEVTTINNITGAGYYTYRLTAADAAAINAEGYKSVGLFRASSNGQNHYVYSVEITGCRSWAVSHTVTFNKMGKGADIASASVVEGDKVTKPTVVEPEGWALAGWYKEEGLVNEWDFDVDVMGEEDITLYAKWEDESGAIKLFDGEGNLNTTNFVSPAKTTIEISSVTYPCLAEFSSNRTSLGGATPADMVQYNATTDKAKIKMTFYNNNSGVKKAILYKYEEGAEAPEKIEIEVPGQTIFTTDYYTFNSTKNRSFYVCMNDRSNIRVLQIKVLDNGTTIHQAGQAGYSVTFNKGRMYVKNGVETSFEGMTINASSEYKVYNNSNLATSSYISFTNAVANTIFKVTRSSSNAYYITNDLDNKGTSYTTDKEVTLTTTGTWYIGAVSGGSAASFTKFEFLAPKCEKPTIDAQPVTNVTFGAGNLTASVTAHVNDGGTLSYQWYNASDDSEVTGADEATLTTTTEGTYYVIVTNTLADHQANSTKSDEATLRYRTLNDATLSSLSYGDPETAIALEADKYEYRVILNEGTVDVPALHATATMDPYPTVDITDATSFTDYTAQSTVHVTAEDGVTELTYTVNFIVKHIYTSLEDVTASTTWNWTGSVDQAINDVPNKGVIIANYIEGDNFEMIEGKAGEYARRNQNGGVYQGTYLHFNTTVPGRVKFYFRAPSGGENCTITVKNGGRTVVAGTRGNSLGWSDEVFVNGDVVVEMVNDKEGGGTTRVQQVVFTTADPNYTRPVTEGRFGTICLPNGGVMIGAALFEVAYHDATLEKIFFDEILNGEMVAGRPYIFLPNDGVSALGVYYTDAADEAAGNYHGLYGSYTQQVLAQEAGNYILYNNQYMYVGASSTNVSVGANRAYFKIGVEGGIPTNAVAPLPGRRRVSMSAVRETPTGLENGELINGENGVQKVLINGELFILRGEKMYDATGRLVK